MPKMSQEQINVDLFDEVKRLKEENNTLKQQLGYLNVIAERGLEKDVGSALETVRNQTVKYRKFYR